MDETKSAPDCGEPSDSDPEGGSDSDSVGGSDSDSEPKGMNINANLN